MHTLSKAYFATSRPFYTVCPKCPVTFFRNIERHLLQEIFHIYSKPFWTKLDSLVNKFLFFKNSALCVDTSLQPGPEPGADRPQGSGGNGVPLLLHGCLEGIHIGRVDPASLVLHAAPHKIIEGIQVWGVWRPKFFGPESLRSELAQNVGLRDVGRVGRSSVLGPNPFFNPISTVEGGENFVGQQLFVLLGIHSPFHPVRRKHFSVRPDHTQHHCSSGMLRLSNVLDGWSSILRALGDVSRASAVRDCVDCENFLVRNTSTLSPFLSFC